jgi:hypothetical protein
MLELATGGTPLRFYRRPLTSTGPVGLGGFVIGGTGAPANKASRGLT